MRQTFFDLFKDGLIYRGKRLVNWDTFLQTAVSDDEVFHETVKGHFWHFRYPVIDPQPGEPDARRRSPRRGPKRCSATRPWPCIPIRPRRSTQAEAELREKLAEAPAEGASTTFRRSSTTWPSGAQTMLPLLIKLRDMAQAGRKVMLPLLQPRDSAGRRRVGQARAGQRLREDHAGARSERLRSRQAAERCR